jgi:L-seryl-tRNA(Ser) seleniumtransferase
MKHNLREIPSINLIQNHQEFTRLVEANNIAVEKLTEIAKEEVELLRDSILNEEWKGTFTKEIAISLILERLASRIKTNREYQLQSVLNATGVIIHTNLGRSRLSDRAIEQITKAAIGYTNLEFNLEKGERGSRHAIIEETLCKVTGAEAAMVVNNNAAAVFFILTCFARTKEVVVSRGELVEIGGSFRISSIMEQSGAILKEVGTTNKTHQKDYQEAINDETAMLMKVHTSNFKVVGFTKSVTSNELIQLAAENPHLIFYEDLGSGALFDFRQQEIGEEPIVSEVLKMGIDLVSFSGDKLLGGPQAGIIAGKKELIDKLKKHQLARALRVDKFTLAALEATLHAYADKTAVSTIPTVRDILMPVDEIEEKAKIFINTCNEQSHGFSFKLDHDYSKIGGGTMPDVVLPTVVVKCIHESLKVDEVVRKLRNGDTPVIVRVKEDQILLDFRTITENEIPQLVSAMIKVEGKTEA